MCAAAALALMALPVSCGSAGRNTTSDGMNANGIYDGSDGRNALNGAGQVIDGAGDAIEKGADGIRRGLDRMDDGMTNNSTTSTTMTTTTTTTMTARGKTSAR